jgi:hypothetical protein
MVLHLSVPRRCLFIACHLANVARLGCSCAEPVCHAGLFHSVYGTEGFQGFTLPLSERPAVRQIIGERAERVAFYNCVMDRHSLDTLVLARCGNRTAAATADADDGATLQLLLRARPSSPAEEKQFVLREQDFLDLISVGMADHLEGWGHQMSKSGKYRLLNIALSMPTGILR